MSAHLEDWLRLLGLEFSATKLGNLLQAFGSPTAVLQAPAEALRRVPGVREADIVAIERAANASIAIPEPLQKGTVRLITQHDSEYPNPLRQIPDPPPALFVWGTIQERDRFGIAVVGTRHPSAYGRMVAERFTRDLCEAGLTIISGGALGIDTIAHRTALECGGRTIAILGSGLGKPYPAENLRLFAQIAEAGGAVVSEFGYFSPPDAWRFPVRNRLIAGWALGTLVIEAGEQSGALITARLAGEYGREVFAVPGNIDNPRSKGCHDLIKNGAILVDSAQDVLDTLRIQREPRPRELQLPMLTPAQEKLLALLTLEPQHLDAIARAAQVPVHIAQVELTTLEMMGLARRMPGGTFVRVL
ncbi:MAG: DNA processing protein DprA [Fimbriimonadales bacterium]|jgi:DNA processing protein|nr:MAG: DNA processing protein DprA [Fimbriimonadales bacterium]